MISEFLNKKGSWTGNPASNVRTKFYYRMVATSRAVKVDPTHHKIFKSVHYASFYRINKLNIWSIKLYYRKFVALYYYFYKNVLKFLRFIHNPNNCSVFSDKENLKTFINSNFTGLIQPQILMCFIIMF